jgi:hypothetical protein
MVITSVIWTGIRRHAVAAAWSQDEQVHLASDIADLMFERNMTAEEVVRHAKQTKDWPPEQQVLLAKYVAEVLQTAGEAEAQAHEEGQRRREQMMAYYDEHGGLPGMED